MLTNREQLTLAPDDKPLEEQPEWRRDFPFDWPKDHYVARRDFTKFHGTDQFRLPQMLGALRQATGTFTPGFVLLSLFALLHLAVIYQTGSGSKPRGQLVSQGVAA